jgi:hypothetical protein
MEDKMDIISFLAALASYYYITSTTTMLFLVPRIVNSFTIIQLMNETVAKTWVDT